MSTILVFAGIAMIILFLLDKVPGVRLLAKPLVEAAVKIITMFIGSFSLWALFLVKSTVRSHLIYFRHLFTHREALAPEERVKHDGTLKP